MPQQRPIIHSDLSGIAQGITSGSSVLAQALGQGMQQNRESSAIQNYMGDLQQAGGDPNSISQAYAKALSSVKDPTKLNMITQNYQQQQKSQSFESALDSAMKAGGFSSPEGQYAFMKEYAKGGGNPIDALKYFKSDQYGQSVFDKKIDEYKAQSVIDYMQGGESSAKTLKNNLNYLQENIGNVGRQKGILTGEFAIAGRQYTEFRNRGNLVLDAVIKVFNKAGVLPQKKLEWIRNTFGVSPMDTREQIQGKINALSSLAKDASGYQEQLGNLIEKYGSNIPTNEFLKLQKNMSLQLEKFDQAVASPQSEKVVSKLPTQGVKMGTPATDTKTGQKYIFNGKRWIKQRG